ncbi:8658_t:CDS:2 [Entrophospora sp. SA101]|nr:8658_t:CDS:2 [Entrophospora sp. SA101]
MSFPLSLGYSPSGVTSVLHLPRHSSDERFAFATSFETSPENFKPELEEENNGALYHRGSKAFPQSQISENKNSEKGQLIRYSGENYLTGLPTRDNIVAENDEGLSTILNNALAKREEIPFMAVDFEGSSEKIGAKSKNSFQISGASTKGAKKGAIDNSEEENDRVQPVIIKIRDYILGSNQL